MEDRFALYSFAIYLCFKCKMINHHIKKKKIIINIWNYHNIQITFYIIHFMQYKLQEYNKNPYLSYHFD